MRMAQLHTNLNLKRFARQFALGLVPPAACLRAISKASTLVPHEK
jgi:hypothetical protein